MPKTKLTTVTFNGTPEQEAALRAELEAIKTLDGPLMPAMQKAQEIYGYLPIEVQKIVAEELNVPLEKVFGIATFYAQFNLNPAGKYPIGVCLGTACYVKGSGEVLARFEKELGISQSECTADGKYSLVATRCIGCCGLAPVATVGQEVYGKSTPDDVPAILAKHGN